MTKVQLEELLDQTLLLIQVYGLKFVSCLQAYPRVKFEGINQDDTLLMLKVDVVKRVKVVVYESLK